MPKEREHDAANARRNGVTVRVRPRETRMRRRRGGGDGDARRSCRCARAFALQLRADGPADREFVDIARNYIWAQNIVTTVWLTTSLDLRKFSASRPYAGIPRLFYACAVRFRNQLNATILAFSTGKHVMVGTHSNPQTIQQAHRVRLDEACEGRPTKFADFCPVNGVYNASTESTNAVDIARIYRDHQDKSHWVPAMFPGLRYDMLEEKVKMRIFERKLVAMGVNHPGHVTRIFFKTRSMVDKYQDVSLPEAHKRYRYRVQQQRRAQADITARKMGMETDTDCATTTEEEDAAVEEPPPPPPPPPSAESQKKETNQPSGWSGGPSFC